VPPVKTFVCVVGTPDTTGPVTGQTSWVDTSPTLQPNTCYDYQVRAQNNNAEVSTWSALARGCTIGAAAAMNLTAAATSSFRVDLNWTVNPTGITTFRVIRDGILLQTVAANASATYTYADITAQPNTTYTYKVDAMNGGTVVSSATVIVTTPAVPAAPINVVATVNNTRQLTVTWADGNTGDVQDGYVIERASVLNGVVGGFTPMTAQGAYFTQTSYVDITALPASIYVYRVKAIRLTVGDSAWTYSVQVSTPLEPLTSVTIGFVAPPTGPFATNSSAAQTGITVRWIDTLNEGGYEVQRCIGYTTAAQCGATGALWKTLPAGSLAADIVTLTDTNVNPATNYVRYRVRATKTGFAPTAWKNSVPASINVPAIPGTPVFTSVSVANSTPSLGLPRITVTWSNVANDLGYVLERSSDDGGTWSLVSNRTAGQTSFVDTAATGLTAPATYRYRVTAIGNGGWNSSQMSSPAQLAAPPTAAVITSVVPTGSVTLQRTRLTLNFTVMADASGWQLERSPGGANSWTVVTSNTSTGSVFYSNYGLTAGTTYDYRVRTYNSGGIALSTTVSGTTAP
jgi:hypothetical protein